MTKLIHQNLFVFPPFAMRPDTGCAMAVRTHVAPKIVDDSEGERPNWRINTMCMETYFPMLKENVRQSSNHAPLLD